MHLLYPIGTTLMVNLCTSATRRLEDIIDTKNFNLIDLTW
jgi:hypothetical protein